MEFNPESSDEKSAPEPETEIFVKNLNFDTTDEGVKRKFEKIGRLYYATVARKMDPRNPGEFLSMGFGFVQFFKATDAAKALKDVQGSLLDGHSLELKLSRRESENGKIRRN